MQGPKDVTYTWNLNMAPSETPATHQRQTYNVENRFVIAKVGGQGGKD